MTEPRWYLMDEHGVVMPSPYESHADAEKGAAFWNMRSAHVFRAIQLVDAAALKELKARIAELEQWHTIDKRPPYDTPLLIKIGSTVQHITYQFDADDNGSWFEPRWFEDNELCVGFNEVTAWRLLPE